MGGSPRLFAQNTKVPISRSKAHIEEVIRKYGGDRFGYMQDKKMAIIAFEINGKPVQLRIPMSDDEQENIRRWRSMFLITKAKLEYIELGYSSIEKEFLSDIMLPHGETIGDWCVPQIALQGPVENILALPKPKEDVVDVPFTENKKP